MTDRSTIVYPYIPNSVPEVKQQMLQEVGAQSAEDFYEDVPERLRLTRPLDLPEPFLSEYALQRHVEGLLSRNRTCGEYLNFLGAGCYQHHVPAVCDEINQRGGFLTAYAGEPYDDHGRFQALFEYASMMGELLNLDVVNVPTYDGFQAAATALRMAARITGRKEILLPEAMSRYRARAKRVPNTARMPVRIQILARLRFMAGGTACVSWFVMLSPSVVLMLFLTAAILQAFLAWFGNSLPVTMSIVPVIDDAIAVSVEQHIGTSLTYRPVSK